MGEYYKMDIIDLKIGSTILLGDEIYSITELHFNETSCIVTLENVENHQIVEKTIEHENDIELVTIEEKEMQFSYEDNGLYYFMDIETYQQLPFTHDMVKDYLKYITEDCIVTMTLMKDKLIDIKPKDIIVLSVTELDDAKTKIIGGKIYKKAILETGMQVFVPMNIELQDKIKIDTTTDAFVEKIEN